MTTLRTLLPEFERDERARDFSRTIFAKGFAHANMRPLRAVLEAPGFENLKRKAAVTAGTTTDLGTLADPAMRAFRDVLVRQTVLGQLPGVVPAPPGAAIPMPVTDPVPAWIGEGLGLPLARISFEPHSTSITKYGVMQAFSREYFRAVDEAFVSLIERVTLRGLRRAEDSLFLSDAAAVAGVSPQGVLFGVSASADLGALWDSVAGGEAAAPAFVTSAAGAMSLASVTSASGLPAFAEVSAATGGTIAGIPLMLSAAAAGKLILIDGSLIAKFDGGLEIDESEQAAVQMVDNSTHNSVTGTGSTVVSAFQTNMIVMRFVRYLNWQRLADDAVGYIELPISGSP